MRLPTRTTTPPNLADRHPFEIYTLAFAAAASAPATFGLADVPVSIQVTATHPEYGRIWVVGVFLGSVLALAGLAWPRRPGVVSVTGLLLEQVGLVVVGVTGIYYAASAFVYGGFPALFPIAAVLGIAVASFTQARRIQRTLKALRLAQEEA